MGVLGKYGGNALKYYGAILASAYQKLSTADMWTSIRTVQAQYGLPTAQATAPDVSVIRGYANRIVAGAQRFAAASPTDSITPDMMAVAPYTSRDLNAIATTPVYQVRFLNTIQAEDGTIVEKWQTSVFTAADFPDTVGGLIDAIQTNADELAATGGAPNTGTPKGISVSTSQHEITLVLGDDHRRPLPSEQRHHVDPARGDHPRHRNGSHSGLPGSTATQVLARPR